MCTSSEQFIWTRLFSGEFSLMEKYFSNANMILLRKRRIFHWINQEMKPKYPVHACVNIQIKGYDFPVLESYQRFLHRTAQSLDLDVTDRYEVYWLFHSKKSLFNIKHYSTVFFLAGPHLHNICLWQNWNRNQQPSTESSIWKFTNVTFR